MSCDECETVAHCLKNGCVPKTTKKDEALKLALEALEGLRNSPSLDSCEELFNLGDEAITALREALAQERSSDEQPAQQEPLDDHAEKEDVESLKRQLSLQTSMCIAYKKENEQLLAANKDCINHFDALKADYDALPAQQEPVAYGIWDTMLGKGNRMMMVRLDKGQDGCTVPLYTSPPAQRKPLTDGDIRRIANNAGLEPSEISGEVFYALRCVADEAAPQPTQRKPLTDEQTKLLWHKARMCMDSLPHGLGDARGHSMIDIIEMAREAGICTWLKPPEDVTERLERFAALVAAAEREACAKVCDGFERAKWESVKNIKENGGRLVFAGPMHCAAAIRARGKTK